MAKRIAVIASHVDTSLRNLLAIWAAGGKRDGEVEIEGYVYPHRAKRQRREGVLKAIKDSFGDTVAYKRVVRAPFLEKEMRWRKADSDRVKVMQLKVGFPGRKVPAAQQRELTTA